MADADLESLRMLAFSFLQNGLYARAADLLAALDHVAPRDTQTLRALALSQLRGNQPAHALKTLKRLPPGDVEETGFRLLRARALSATGAKAEVTP